MTRKLKCNERRCGWQGTQDTVLSAPNPFDPSDTILGCPDCKGVECLVVVCDVPECWADVSCGTPTDDGYRNTCFAHKPRERVV